MKLVSQIVLIASTLAAIAGGVFLLVRDSSSDGAVEIVLRTATAVSQQPELSTLKVYVSGAVRNPGVYTVSDGDRLDSVIEAAGGATDEADLSLINLALRVKDEDHWHIPKQGEPLPAVSSRGSGGSEKIDVNVADAPLLESLPGIGEVKARANVSYREANGPFSRVEDLLDVRGIGAATLEAIRDLVEVR